MNIEQDTTTLVKYLEQYGLVPSRAPPKVASDLWHLCRIANAISCDAAGNKPTTVGASISYGLLCIDPVAYGKLCQTLGVAKSNDAINALDAKARIAFDLKAL